MPFNHFKMSVQWPECNAVQPLLQPNGRTCSSIFPSSNLDPSNYDHACCIHRFAYSGDVIVISSMCPFLLGISLLAQCFQSSSILEHVSGLHCISIHPASMYVYATLSLLTHLLMDIWWLPFELPWMMLLWTFKCQLEHLIWFFWVCSRNRIVGADDSGPCLSWVTLFFWEAKDAC